MRVWICLVILGLVLWHSRDDDDPVAVVDECFVVTVRPRIIPANGVIGRYVDTSARIDESLHSCGKLKFKISATKWP